MLYTSYFAKQKKNTINNLYAITYRKPDFFDGEWLECVAPTQALVHQYKEGMISQKDYTDIYWQQLSAREDIILETIKSLPEDSILLCYEGPTDFCHRHILAQWLKVRNIEVKEWTEKCKKAELF